MSVSSPQAEVMSVPVVVPAETSALEALHGAADRFELESASATSAILDRPAAREMAAAVRASRVAERSQLATDRSPSANGMAAALVPARQKVVMPLAEGSYRITSRYGTRQNPFGGAAQSHYGVDLAAPLDTPIHAVADGVVTYVGQGRAGRSSMLIIIKHEIEDQTVYTWYNHMYASGLYVEPGETVEAGQVIAGVGSNGNSTGPHLHLEVHTDDQLSTVNPLSWLQEHEAVDVGEL
ncbi:M23 family metallopeptidase [Georgenia phoenicis]|uniref:M23 family metallopeptidase n=1 Tax=unclassified Georgenia TaxID=2626815 RepID=UPI0039AF4066